MVVDSTDTNPGMVPPTIYYAKVAGELGKMAVKGRNMYPPYVSRTSVTVPINSH